MMKLHAFKQVDGDHYICRYPGLSRGAGFAEKPSTEGIGFIPALYTWEHDDPQVKRNLTVFRSQYEFDFEYVEVQLSLSE